MCRLGNGGGVGKLTPRDLWECIEVKGQVVIPGANKEMRAGQTDLKLLL